MREYIPKRSFHDIQILKDSYFCKILNPPICMFLYIFDIISPQGQEMYKCPPMSSLASKIKPIIVHCILCDDHWIELMPTYTQ